VNNYDGFYVYRKYLALKLHFEKDDYDYFTTSGHVHTKLHTFTKRNDKYQFHKLSVKYKQSDIEDFLVSNFIKDTKLWSGKLLERESHERYLQYKKRKESRNYHFKEDLGRISTACDMDNIEPNNAFVDTNGNHPKVLRLCIGNKICTETLIIMDYHLNFMKDWNKNIKETIVWPNLYKKIMNFKPFVRFNEIETRTILKEVFLK